MEYREIGAGGAYSTSLVCLTCGGLVWDKELHDKWHARMDLFETVRASVRRGFEDLERGVQEGR